LAQGKARFAPWCPTLQAKRNAALRQKNPACGGMKPAIGCVPPLARCESIAPRDAPARTAGLMP